MECDNIYKGQKNYIQKILSALLNNFFFVVPKDVLSTTYQGLEPGTVFFIK